MTDGDTFNSLLSEYWYRQSALVPVPANSKGPVANRWQSREWQLEDFHPEGNLGVILGPRSCDLADVYLDCHEAVALAPTYLPPSGAIFGRASKPRSHWLFTAPGAILKTFADPLLKEKNTLLELRAPGRDGGCHQTLLPPSIADGERRDWESSIEPAPFDAVKLRQRCAWLAVACLVMRYVMRRRLSPPRLGLPGAVIRG